MLRLGWVGTYAQTQHDDRDDVVGRGSIDVVHDQELMVSEARLSLDLGITRRFGASLLVPVRVVGTSIRYLDAAGSEVRLAGENIHHRNETVSGLADPMLLGSASFALGDWRVTARAGATIPLGRTEEDPFVLAELGLRHQHVQMGTGTVNPVVAAELARSWGAWRAGLFALSQQVVYESGKGYQAGDRYAGGVVVQRRLGERWTVRGGVDALVETAERWNGITHSDDGNRGRFDLIFGAGASWAATQRLGIDVSLKIPAVTHAVGGQLDMPALVEVGASWALGRPASARVEVHEHEHGEHEHGEHEHGEHEHGEHEHGEHEHGAQRDGAPHVDMSAHPDTAGLDVADIGQPGEAVDLVPVPGKITIFDFWAAWCEPCKVLEPALVEIVRAHPDRVALRRVDVVDWDSAAVARYLTPGGFNLPHLKVFDASGRRVIERSSAAGQLEKLVDDVRALVERDAGERAMVPPGAP